MHLIRSYRQGVLGFSWPINGDRVGVVASVLCAIHCAVTPLLLVALPVFGKVWSHPASHWLMAMLVVPLAAVTVATGYTKHRRGWVIACAALGILFVLAGAAAPSFEQAPEAGGSQITNLSTSSTTSETIDGLSADSSCDAVSEASTGSKGGAVDSLTSATDAGTSCVDSCCPSLQAGEDGGWRLHVPLASILTTIGGLFLIVTHIGNLCRSPCCKPEHAACRL